LKRSQINRIITENLEFIRQLGFCLPPFAYWTLEEFEAQKGECKQLIDNMLGWDVSDYGFGDFYRCGIVAFTIRSGNHKSGLYQKPYAEKLLILEPGQACPMHFHPNKIEDLINRGGGDFLIQMYASDDNGGLSKEPVEIFMDGRVFNVKAGEKIRVKPGESVTLKPRQCHTFWADDKKVLFGEVTMNDNAHCFYGNTPGLMEIEEDEPLKHVLSNDYYTYFL